jgi:hypothetical protein
MATGIHKKNAKYKMGDHYDKIHKELLPKDMSGYQWFYYTMTGKDHGSCIICKNNTRFNNLSMKYSRFCDNPACKQKYRDEFKERMIGKYGKIHLLNDPEKQKEMLGNRKISGTYTWSDRSVTLNYAGSYELDFLKFLDLQCKWVSSDIISPSPHVFEYKYNDQIHFYIPDFFIPSLSLQIEIKGDGSSIRNMDKNKIKDELMRSNINYFNYIKIVNKNYKEFLDIIRGD